MKVKRTKFNDYEYRIKFPVFMNYTIHVVVCDSLSKAISERYKGCHPEIEHILARTMIAASPDTHMFFKTESIFKPYELANVIAHESVHALRHMFEYVRVGRTEEGDFSFDNETEAYHLGYTVERATRFFEEVRNDIRTRAAKSSKRRNRG
jgi:hypothetical protein